MTIKKILFKSILFLCLAVGIFVSGMWFGGTKNLYQELVNKEGQPQIEKIINLYSKNQSNEADFDQFWELWDKIKRKYVKQPVKDADLFYGAMQGLVRGLDDPYSAYFPPKEALEFAESLSGEFEGIGAEIGKKKGQLTVIAPLPKSPAELAGLKTGDLIYAINKEETFELELDEAVSKIRGPKGTTVVLTIGRDGGEEIKDISIIRDKIVIPTVVYEKKENNIAYMRVSVFNEDTWEEFDKVAREVVKNSPKGIILDLRSNPGGYLQTAVDVASEWVVQGQIVLEKFADDSSNEYKSRGAHRFAGIPTVVLVDEGTASGSEIVAGALQDYKLAQIVGKNTFGKGSVQEFEPLSDGSALKITVAKWYTPNGRQIDETGIAPDITLPEIVVQNENGGIDDKGMEKAMELLNAGMK